MRGRTLATFAIPLFALFLSGCALTEQEQPISYYVLDASPLPIKEKRSREIIEISAINLPDYLNQPNLVLRDASQQIHIAYYHSWADNLATAIRRVLVQELNQTSRNYSFTHHCDTCQRIEVQIDHFYPTTLGDVILSGEFQQVKGKNIELRENFLIKVALGQDGYEHAVKKMRSALTQLAAGIEKKVR